MTREEFIKILPLYIGQSVLVNGNTFLLYSVDIEDEIMLNNPENGGISNHRLDWGETKLILRPLSDITEAELLEWSRIGTTVGEMHIESALQIHWAKRINYYRSIGIDCDGLLGTQWAIDKTKM